MSANEFHPIRTASLRGDQKIQFDIYVPVGGRQIIYLRKGDSFEGARLTRLKEKQLKKLFIRSEDEPLYLKYLEDNVNQAYDMSAKMSIESRAEIIQGAQHANAEAVLESPEDKKTYDRARSESSRYVEFLSKEERAVRAIINAGGADSDLALHGVAVGTISVGIAKRIGIKALADLQLLVLGSLLHDFGHIDADYKIFSPLEELDELVRLGYRRHPADGLMAAQLHQHFDEAVVAMIAEHEELYDGTGYPNRLGGNLISPLALIVSTANAFDRMMRHEKLGRDECLKKFVATQAIHHHPEHVKALISL